MSDVFDEIIDALPPATVRLMMAFDRCLVNCCACTSNVLSDFQKIKSKQIDKEVKIKTVDLKSKAAENRTYLTKLKKELEILNAANEPKSNSQNQKAYSMKIGELECQIKELTEGQSDVDVGQLFDEVEKLNEQIEEYRKKISEARSQNKCYDGFPANVEQGKEVIAQMKEKIKQQELTVEAWF